MWMSEEEEPPVTGRSMSRPARQDALSQSLVAYMLANIRVFPHSFQSKLLHRNKIVVRLKIPGNRLQALQYHASTAINLIANSSQIPPQGSQTLRLRLGLGPSDLRQTFFAQGRARSADRPAATSATSIDATASHACDLPWRILGPRAAPGYTGRAVVAFTRSSTKLVLQSCTLGCLSRVSMMKRL